MNFSQNVRNPMASGNWQNLQKPDGVGKLKKSANHEDIGDEVGVDQKTVSNFLQKIRKTGCGGKSVKSANHIATAERTGSGWNQEPKHSVPIGARVL